MSRALLVAIAVAMVAACRPPPPPAKPPPAPAARANAVRAGTSGDYPPLSTWTDGHAGGFAPALLEAFAATSRLDVAWSRFRWPDLATDLAQGRFDIAADGITVRPERSIVGRYTVPIARGGVVLLLRRPSWATAADVRALDRPELRIAVNAGGHLETVARRLFHAATILPIADNAVREVLARGGADAAMTNTFEAPRWAAGLEGIERVGPLTKDTTALWVRAEREDLAEQLDSWLLAEEGSGRLEALRQKHLAGAGGGPSARPVIALLASTSERLALMPFVAGAKARSGAAVEDTAQEARVIVAGERSVAKAAAAIGRPPPPRDRVEAFFRAQIEAAKAIQRTTPPVTSRFTLDRDLRPAIAWITRRMAFLLVRLGHVAKADVAAQAREELEETGLEAERVDAIAAAIASLAE